MALFAHQFSQSSDTETSIPSFTPAGKHAAKDGEAEGKEGVEDFEAYELEGEWNWIRTGVGMDVVHDQTCADGEGIEQDGNEEVDAEKGKVLTRHRQFLRHDQLINCQG